MNNSTDSTLRLREVWKVLTLAVLLLFGCGKDEVLPEQVDLQPVYAILPDTAPLEDQMQEAVGAIERDLLEEQEKFFLKRIEDIRRYYTGPDGKRLISEESWNRMINLMNTRFPVRLKVICRKFRLMVPESLKSDEEGPVQTSLHLMDSTIPAVGLFTGKVKTHTIWIDTIYTYNVQSDPIGQNNRKIQVPREIFYTKTPAGQWLRSSIREGNWME